MLIQAGPPVIREPNDRHMRTNQGETEDRLFSLLTNKYSFPLCL